MIKCFIVLCSVANPQHCLPPEEITPIDHAVTTPFECLRGGGGVTPQAGWFVKTYAKLEGDGSDIVRTWLRDQRARAERLTPQIK